MIPCSSTCSRWLVLLHSHRVRCQTIFASAEPMASTVFVSSPPAIPPIDPYFYASSLSLFRPSLFKTLNFWLFAKFRIELVICDIHHPPKYITFCVVNLRSPLYAPVPGDSFLYLTSHIALSSKTLHSIRTDALPFIWDYLSIACSFSPL